MGTFYTITLTADEFTYLREALDVRMEYTELPVVLAATSHEQGIDVTINETGYDLIRHLRFGGLIERDWYQNSSDPSPSFS